MTAETVPNPNDANQSADGLPIGQGMYLSELRVQNFRSCYNTVVPLREDVTVLVGENNSGKSNVVDALRLAITPMGGRRSRYFEPGDVSFGHERDGVGIALRFDGLTEIQRGQYLTALDVSNMTAVYGTRFEIDLDRPSRSRPVNTAGPGQGPDAEPAKREEICHVYLEPLRDAQRDLDSAGSRRLATIIEDLHAAEEVTAFVEEANAQFRTIEEHDIVTTTATEIAGYLVGLTNPVRGQQIGLLFRDYKLHRLAAALRVKLSEAGIDLADIADSGLGYANLLFIATVLLQLRAATEAELTLLLVEEPEAHLHPQLQSVLLDYLREQASSSVRDDTTGPAGRIQVVVTTHSPIIASSVPLHNVVVLRSTKIEVPPPEPDSDDAVEPAVHAATVAIAVAELGLDAQETRKIDQYLDATKASLLLGTRVLLVEGVSEAVLLPVVGRRLYPDDDEFRARRRALSGLTIVTIGSVDFEPYVRLLLGQTPAGYSILDQLVVITDSDPVPLEDDDEGDDGADSATDPPPAPRVTRLHALAEGDQRLRVFTAARTLEADLLAHSTNESVLRSVFVAQKPRSTSVWEAIVESDNPAESFYKRLRSNSAFIAKGQFAHDLAISIENGDPFECPTYLADAIAAALDQ